MVKVAIVFYLFPVFTSCVYYIDRVKSGYSRELCGLMVNYTHNAEGACVTNVTIVNYFNVTKLVACISVCVPESRNDQEYKRELVRTVVDVEKALKGLQ